MLALAAGAGALAFLAVNDMQGGGEDASQVSPNNKDARLARDLALFEQNGSFSRSAHGLGDPNVRTNYTNLRATAGRTVAVVPMLKSMAEATARANQYTYDLRRVQSDAVSQYQIDTKPCSREYLFPTARALKDPYARVTYPEGVPVTIRPYYKTQGEIPSDPVRWLISQWNPGVAYNQLNRYREVPRAETMQGANLVPASAATLARVLPTQRYAPKGSKKVRFSKMQSAQ